MRAVTSSGRFWLPLRRTLSVAIVLSLLVSLLAPTLPTSVQAQDRSSQVDDRVHQQPGPTPTGLSLTPPPTST